MVATLSKLALKLIGSSSEDRMQEAWLVGAFVLFIALVGAIPRLPNYYIPSLALLIL